MGIPVRAEEGGDALQARTDRDEVVAFGSPAPDIAASPEHPQAVFPLKGHQPPTGIEKLRMRGYHGPLHTERWRRTRRLDHTKGEGGQPGQRVMGGDEVAPRRAKPTAKPAPTSTCVADDAWRKRLDMDLSDLEKRSKLPLEETDREVRALHDAAKAATTSQDCARVDARFEAFMRRALPPPRATPSPEASNVAGVRECTMSVQWRRGAEQDLLQYRQLIALLGVDAFAEFEVAEDRLVAALNAATDGTDCRALDAKIEALIGSWRKRVDVLCPSNGAWKNKAKLRALDAEGLEPTKQTELIEQIQAATNQRDCLTVQSQLASLPLPRPPAKASTCEPTEEWKKMMFGNLAMLEGRANSMKPVEVERESLRVGGIIHRAHDQQSCLQAIKAFESFKARALKEP
jgi:hypothetical protein